MPPTMVLTIVVTLLVALSVSAVMITVMMNYLTIVHDTARQAQYQGRQDKCTDRAKPV